MSVARGLTYFPCYPDDVLADGRVMAMTAEQFGAYWLLLLTAWREVPAGTVPNDDRILARWARLTPRRWQAVKAAVLAPFHLQDGRWHQKRMEREFRHLLERSERARESAERRWSKDPVALGSEIGVDANAMRSDIKRSANALSRHRDRKADGMPPASLSDSDSSGSSSGAFKPPTLEEVQHFWIEADLSGDPEKFWNHHQAYGWKGPRGKSIRDWRAAARTWHKNEIEFSRSRRGQQLPGNTKGRFDAETLAKHGGSRQ